MSKSTCISQKSSSNSSNRKIHGSQFSYLLKAASLLIFLTLLGQAQCVLNCSEVWMANPTTVNDSCTCVSSAYVWNPSTNKCGCSSTAIDLGNGYCADCKLLENAVGYANNTCTCVTGYIWASNWNECVLNCGGIDGTIGAADGSMECGCREGLRWNAASLSCDIDCTTISNTVNQGDGQSTGCSCVSGMAWNSTSKTCQTVQCDPNSAQCYDCPTGFYWDITNSRCQLDCFDLGAATNATDPNTCVCSGAYQWDPTNNNCVSTCTGNYTVSADDSACQLDCTKFTGTDGTAASEGRCTCLQDVYSWDETLLVCALDCSKIDYAANKTSDIVCSCEAGYTWIITKECVLDCSQVSNTANFVLINGSCSCRSGFTWRADILICELNCLAISNTNSTFPQAVNGSCICNENYIWSSTQLVCVLNCSSIQGAIPAANNTCGCIDKFYWDTIDMMCKIDCWSIASASTIATNRTICSCKTPYSFDTNTLTCILNCSIISFTQNTSTSSDPTSCTCQANFLWNSRFLRCDPNCSNPQIGNGRPAVNGRCSCPVGYSWDVSSVKCLLNCSKITNADTSQTQPSLTTCACINKYSWDKNTTRCRLNCSLVVGTVTVGLASTCRCGTGFSWNMVGLVCEIKCSSKRNVKPNTTALANGDCQCKEAYYWDSNIKQCQMNCYNITNARPTTDYTICSCETGFSWDRLTTTCVPRCGVIKNSLNGRMTANNTCKCATNFYWVELSTCVKDCASPCRINCTAISNAYFRDPVSYSDCYCNVGYTWNSNTKKCVGK